MVSLRSRSSRSRSALSSIASREMGRSGAPPRLRQDAQVPADAVDGLGIEQVGVELDRSPQFLRSLPQAVVVPGSSSAFQIHDRSSVGERGGDTTSAGHLLELEVTWKSGLRDRSRSGRLFNELLERQILWLQAPRATLRERPSRSRNVGSPPRRAGPES